MNIFRKFFTKCSENSFSVARSGFENVKYYLNPGLCRRQFSPSSRLDLHDAKPAGEITERLFHGVLKGDRAALSESITLVESTNHDKQLRGQRLLGLLLGHKQKVQDSKVPLRVGISGIPGAGKSTFLECLGCKLIDSGQNVSCLTVDPSSRITGGSLLGDKTRMPRLSRSSQAFIRPSPSSGVLGGVTRTTSETILLCEAAGYDTIFVETVGAGQNEFLVADMVDILVMLVAPGQGDELQALKRGIMELCDIVLVNKADGDLLPAARRTQTEYVSALKFMRGRKAENFQWNPKVMKISSVTGEGVDKAWETICQFRDEAQKSGYLQEMRKKQNIRWMWRFIEEALHKSFRNDPRIINELRNIEKSVLESSITPLQGATTLLDIHRKQFS